MTEKLLRLIERAKRYQMTAEEKREQQIRFAYGNAHYENDEITMELVAEALRDLPREPAGEVLNPDGER